MLQLRSLMQQILSLKWLCDLYFSSPLRHGISAGPDAGWVPLPSAVSRALQHVQAVHAQQAHKA